MSKTLIIGAILWAAFSMTGCRGGEEPADETGVLSIGLMPAVDSAPIFAARDAGYFTELGLDLQIIIFTNAQDRQSALQTGQIDGAMTDLVALAVNVSSGFGLRATTLTDGMFPVLANPGTRDKEQISMGLMEVSVSNFLVDQWMSRDYEIDKVYINAIPARLEAVGSGQLDMGLFPEPIASAGLAMGLEKILFEPVDGFSPDVMAFTDAAIADKSSALEKFHSGYNTAVADINSDKDVALDALFANIPNLNPAARGLVQLPEYHMARLPDPAYLNKIIDWTAGLVELNVEAAELVDGRFIQ